MLPRSLAGLRRLRRLALAGGSLALAAAVAAAQPRPYACKADAGRYCAETAAAGKCLRNNWGRLSPACRDELAGPPGDPCRELILERCSQPGPQDSLRECLDKQLPEASPACQQQVERSHRKGPCSEARRRYCKDALSEAEAVRCLIRRIDDIPFPCLEELHDSAHWVHQCRSETAKFCRNAKGARATCACLAEKADQLSPWCRKFVARMRKDSDDSCAGDAAAICKDASAQGLRACLLAHKDKLSAACAQKLSRGQK